MSEIKPVKELDDIKCDSHSEIDIGVKRSIFGFLVYYCEKCKDEGNHKPLAYQCSKCGVYLGMPHSKNDGFIEFFCPKGHKIGEYKPEEKPKS